MTQSTNERNSPNGGIGAGNHTGCVGATMGFTTFSPDGEVIVENTVHVSAEGIEFEDRGPINAYTLAAMMPALLRVHAALFGRDE